MSPACRSVLRTASHAVALLACIATASGQTVPVPNASFEDGDGGPAGWKLSGGQGDWLTEGADGRRAVAVTGDGKGTNHWLSDPLPLEPGGVYCLTFKARSTGGGTVVAGPLFCNADLGAVPGRWETYTSIFAVPADVKPDRARIRFGQWHLPGTAAFDDVHLCRAMPVYAHEGDLALGEGEMLRGTAYTFDAPFGAVSRNQARPLQRFTAGFNSNRWTFWGGDEVVYRHAVEGRRHSGGEVDVSVTWHNAGELAVEASANGAAWRPLGTLEGVTGGTFAVPADLLPAESVWIRLRGQPAEGKGRASLQVSGYSYRATLDGPPATLIGKTRFVSVLLTDSRFSVTIEDLGESVPGGDNEAVIRVRNTTKQPIPVFANVWVVDSSRRKVPRFDEARAVLARLSGPGAETRTLEPGENVIRHRYDLSRPGDAVVTIRLFTGVLSMGRRTEEALIADGVVNGFIAKETLNIPTLHSASYGQALPASSDAVGLWWCPSGWKVSRKRGLPTAKGDAIRIAAAQNEADAAQLVLRPKESLKGLTVEASALAGPGGAVIPASVVEVLKVRYVLVTKPTDAAGCVGWWPDPLPPLAGPLDVEAGTNQPLWVRVTVPRDAAPGTYRGTIRLKAAGYAAEAPLEVRVFGFALPDRMTCQSAFGLRENTIWQYQNLKDEADRRAVLAKYHANFAAHHISPYDPAPMDPIRVTWPTSARRGAKNPLPTEKIAPDIDFAAWDAAMTQAIDRYHFNSFRLRIPGMGGGSFHRRSEPNLLGWTEDTPQYQAAFTAYCRRLQEYLREKGWLDEAYVYWFDEPAPKDYAFVMNGFRKLKEAAPDLQRMLTEQIEPGLVGGPNLWCPLSPNYDHAKAEQRRAAGDRFWWYVCCGPKAPHAGLFIDHPATELRVWLWQTWRRKIEGILIWSTNYWTSTAAYPDRDRPQNPYDDPMGWVSGYSTDKGVRRPWGNGDGRFVYPPESCADAHPPGPVLDGPVDSIRWEMLRDGLEDYEYLVILRRLLAEKGERLPTEVRARCEALLEVPEAISHDMTHFTADPAPIEARRAAIAEAIEALGKK